MDQDHVQGYFEGTEYRSRMAYHTTRSLCSRIYPKYASNPRTYSVAGTHTFDFIEKFDIFFFFSEYLIVLLLIIFSFKITKFDHMNNVALCRGWNLLSNQELTKLLCYYSSDDPYFILHPVKVSKVKKYYISQNFS